MLLAKHRKGYITDLHKAFGIFNNFILTKYGSIICGIELSGRDFDSLLPDDFTGLSLIARNIYEKLPHSVNITLRRRSAFSCSYFGHPTH